MNNYYSANQSRENNRSKNDLKQQRKQVLYLVLCAAPPASNAQDFIKLAQFAGWDVCVIATPQATTFIDSSQLEGITGHPIRSKYKLPGEPDIFPKPDRIVIAPATFNTINKLASGIADTLATSILCEGVGRGIPILAAPCLKSDLAQHPAFSHSLKLLREWGIKILYEPDKHHPSNIVPWEMIIEEITKIQKPNR